MFMHITELIGLVFFRELLLKCLITLVVFCYRDVIHLCLEIGSLAAVDIVTFGFLISKDP